ncbi:MAG: hypothetical protein KKB88_00515 [Nanoarchaeota archaeon]|nr:hypothetical protein [Nanoarchaeota archaeon]
MDKREIKKIMKETCWGSLSFCCDFSKKCESRDNVIRKLNLGISDIKKLKENFDRELLELLKK